MRSSVVFTLAWCLDDTYSCQVADGGGMCLRFCYQYWKCQTPYRPSSTYAMVVYLPATEQGPQFKAVFQRWDFVLAGFVDVFWDHFGVLNNVEPTGFCHIFLQFLVGKVNGLRENLNRKPQIFAFNNQYGVSNPLPSGNLTQLLKMIIEQLTYTYLL